MSLIDEAVETSTMDPGSNPSPLGLYTNRSASPAYIFSIKCSLSISLYFQAINLIDYAIT